jgi:sporulation protein YlmC with PRC-barrel domain
MRTTYLAALFASALIATPVLVPSAAVAQRSEQPGARPQASSGNWLQQEKPGHWRATKLKGLNVYNNNNEKIGDVVELLVDQSGKIDAVVIGVGGFLGIGEHDVAVPFNQLRWSHQSVGSGRETTGAGDRSDRSPQGYPDHAILNMTKEQLKAAPEFRFAR